MRRLVITGFFAIALLSGCAGGGVGVGGGPLRDIALPCPGKNYNSGKWQVDKNVKETVRFHTDGRCKFDVQFDPPYPRYPPGFSNRVANPNGEEISYSYDGTPIPDPGYPFTYTNDYPEDGNGSGVVKN
jgi:hypothetical protein